MDNSILEKLNDGAEISYVCFQDAANFLRGKTDKELRELWKSGQWVTSPPDYISVEDLEGEELMEAMKDDMYHEDPESVVLTFETLGIHIEIQDV